jgi:hypothetical protein
MTNTETYTLDKLSKLLGTPTELQAKANAPTEPDAELIKRGAEIASYRIVTDVERLYGLAYAAWAKASDEQKELLLGFSEEVLCYAVDRALALRELTAVTSESEFLDEAEVARRKTVASTTFTEALSLRDRARNILKKAAPTDAMKQEIEEAVGTAEDDDKLAAGLNRLAALGQRMLETKDEVAKARLSAVRLSLEFLQKLINAAEKVRATAKDASAKATVKRTSQGDIDRLDGVNLVLLGEIVNTFEDAHDSDPSIPRLVPISTRRLLGKRTRQPAADKAEKPKS